MLAHTPTYYHRTSLRVQDRQRAKRLPDTVTDPGSWDDRVWVESGRPDGVCNLPSPPLIGGSFGVDGKGNFSDLATMTSVIEGPLVRGEGHEWLLRLEESEFGPGDVAEAPSQSRLLLWEDGVPLTPHAVHSEIVALGGGRFSHWAGWLRFSSSDGSDPNANGKSYAIGLDEAKRPSLLAMGSCHMHAAVQTLVQAGKVEQLWSSPGLSYSPGETLQLLRHYRGEKTISGELTDLALSAAPDNILSKILGRADCAAVEFSALTDIEMDGVRLVRSRVDDILLAPYVALGAAEGALARKWYIYGLLRGNERIRMAAAEEMAPILDRIPDSNPMAREVLARARGRPGTTEQALDDYREIIRLIDVPRVVLMLSHNLFSLRGDPISWDGYFPEEMKSACEAVGLRAFLSGDIVLAVGVEAALEPDLLHFRPGLGPAIGAAILSALEI